MHSSQFKYLFTALDKLFVVPSLIILTAPYFDPTQITVTPSCITTALAYKIHLFNKICVPVYYYLWVSFDYRPIMRFNSASSLLSFFLGLAAAAAAGLASVMVASFGSGTTGLD
jgi:hypothetical protein